MKPDFSMRGSAIWPVAQAIALGPVPDGSMKPQLAAMAALTASFADGVDKAEFGAAIGGQVLDQQNACVADT